jgi:hypothetical protein
MLDRVRRPRGLARKGARGERDAAGRGHRSPNESFERCLHALVLSVFHVYCAARGFVRKTSDLLAIRRWYGSVIWM